ncbi:MAG: ScyD/ScyE family protein [Candidatus Promineifilaceae bacterium]
MSRFRVPLLLAAGTLFALLLVISLSPGAAWAGPAAPGTAGAFEVIATDLLNARGLAFGPDGALYIAEAGSGGDGVCVPGPENSENCYGTTGQISKVEFDADGNPADQTVLISGLSSIAAKDTGEEAIGPNDLAFSESGDLYFLMGLGADPAVRDPSGPFGAAGMDFGQLVMVDSELNMDNVADVSAYEGTNNPDGAQVDSNPYGLLPAGDDFAVVDAGGNSLLSVANISTPTTTAAAADISTLAVFPAQMVEFPPGSGSMIPMDAVPTAVEMGPDGAYYVSQLTGFPFPVGGASIFRVEPGEAPTVYQTGFTNILDLAFGPDGSLYVLEMAKDSLLADPPPMGRITQITPYGARSTFAEDGLIAPVDMEIGPDHALYVINLGPTTSSQVVRYELPVSTVSLDAAKDNTLYESETGMVSNGQGQHFFAGAAGAKSGTPSLRRGVIAFDVSADVPAGATILGATLELNMSKTIVDDKAVTLHPLMKDWGEGASDADGEEGAGATAATGDATWLHNIYDTEMWSTAGGDFEATASASTVVGGIGKYAWSSAQVTADVQEWLDNPDGNYGWLLLGDESGTTSVKRFDTRENPQEENRPKLIIEYVMPLPDYAIFAPVVSSP